MDWLHYADALREGYILDAGEAENGAGVGYTDDEVQDDGYSDL